MLNNLLGRLLSLKPTIIMKRFTYAKQETVKDLGGMFKLN